MTWQPSMSHSGCISSTAVRSRAGIVRPRCDTVSTSVPSTTTALRNASSSSRDATATGIGPLPDDLAHVTRLGVATHERGVIDPHDARGAARLLDRTLALTDRRLHERHQRIEGERVVPLAAAVGPGLVEQVPLERRDRREDLGGGVDRTADVDATGTAVVGPRPQRPRRSDPLVAGVLVDTRRGLHPAHSLRRPRTPSCSDRSSRSSSAPGSTDEASAMASTWAVDSAPARSAASVEGRDAKRDEVSSVVRAAPTEAPVAAANQSAASRCAPPCFQAPVATTWRAASDLPAALRRSSSPNASTSERRPYRRTGRVRTRRAVVAAAGSHRGGLRTSHFPVERNHRAGEAVAHSIRTYVRVQGGQSRGRNDRRRARRPGRSPPRHIVVHDRNPARLATREVDQRNRSGSTTSSSAVDRRERCWARRLSEEATCSVLVLEAGPAGPLDSDADLLSNVSFALTGRDWGMRARVTGERELDYPQGKFLGGGSSVNGALAFRGSPADYDGWAAQHNPRWSWDHMLPCFRRLEHDLDFGADHAVHGEDGPVPIVRWGHDELLPVQQAFADACVSMGIPWVPDHNHPAATGIGPLPMNRAEGRRMSTALAYLAPASGATQPHHSGRRPG